MSTKNRELDQIHIVPPMDAFMACACKGMVWVERYNARRAFAKMIRLVDQINMGEIRTEGWSRSKCKSVARKYEEAMYWWLYRSDCCNWTLGAHTGTASWVRCAETSGHYTLWMMRMIVVEALTNRGGDR